MISWIESAFVWPAPYEADLFDGSGIRKSRVRFPAGTAFAWTRWSPEGWNLRRQNRVGGLSMGGRAQRIRVEAEPTVEKAAEHVSPAQLAATHGSVVLR